MSGKKSGGAIPYGSLFVGGAGAVLLLVAIFGYFLGKPGETTIAFVVIGAGLVAVGPLIERVSTFKIGPTGTEMTVGDKIAVAVGEQQVEQGQIADAETVLELDTPAIPGIIPSTEEAPSEEATTVIHGDGIPPVLVTQAAADTLQRIKPWHRDEIIRALADLGKTDQDKRIGSNAAGVDYMSRRISPNIRLIYRLSDAALAGENPNVKGQHVILAVQTPSDRKRWWPDDLRS